MTTIGVLGGRWRATVSPTGTVAPWDGGPPLSWHVAADDRWHVPATEPSVRQRCVEGTPVVESRIKVPSGDAVHRVWCVADGGGHTVVEVENESSLPFAVAFDHPGLLSQRSPAAVPIRGIDLPATTVVFPVGHRSTLRVAIAHDSITTGTGRALELLASADQVARGWIAVLDQAGRLVLPDEALIESITRARAELALRGPTDPADAAARFLTDTARLVRMGEPAAAWVATVADAVASVAPAASTWQRTAALDAAAVVLARAGETRALRDLAGMWSAPPSLPPEPPSGDEQAWHEHRLARACDGDTAELLPLGIPAAWLGSNIEAHDLPVGPDTTVSYALRWHGQRPAVLWEMSGRAVTLTAPVAAPGWSSHEPKGEALWPAGTYAPGAGLGSSRV